MSLYMCACSIKIKIHEDKGKCCINTNIFRFWILGLFMCTQNLFSMAIKPPRLCSAANPQLPQKYINQYLEHRQASKPYCLLTWREHSPSIPGRNVGCKLWTPRQPEQNRADPDMTYNPILHHIHSTDGPRKKRRLSDFGKKPHIHVTKMTIRWG